MQSQKPRCHELVAAIVVPIGDVDAVHDALLVVTNGGALPFAGPVIDERNMTSILRRARLRAGQRSVDHHLLAAAIDVCPTQAMRRRQPVDFSELPRLPRIALMPQYAHDSEALR